MEVYELGKSTLSGCMTPDVLSPEFPLKQVNRFREKSGIFLNVFLMSCGEVPEWQIQDCFSYPKVTSP
jgi:hypothetical protein